MSDKNSNNGCFYLFFAVAILIIWGGPSWISGKGFFNGIEGNLKAIPYVLATLVIGYAVLKYFDSKS